MTTINEQIAASTDDGYETDDTSINLDNTSAQVGHLLANEYDAGLRWQSVNVPNSVTLTSATLSILLAVDIGTLASNIRGIDEDNTATWSSGSRPSQRAKTTATINANEANWSNWGASNWATINVTSVIQEIINRGGWSANNALAIVIENTGSDSNYVTFTSWDATGNVSGAKLDIVYPSPTGKNSRSTMNVHSGVMFQTLTGGHGY